MHIITKKIALVNITRKIFYKPIKLKINKVKVVVKRQIYDIINYKER